MALQILDVADGQGVDVGCGQAYPCCTASFQGLLPTFGTETPVITCGEAGKAVFGMWRAQVVADLLGIIQELSGNLDTDQVLALVGWVVATTTVAGKTREWLHVADLQRFAHDVEFHGLGQLHRRVCSRSLPWDTILIRAPVSSLIRHTYSRHSSGKSA